MFITKNRRIDIKKLYINDHVMDQFHDRKTKKDIEFSLPKEIIVNIMPQRTKENGAVEVDKLRGIIQLKNKLFMVINMYEKNGEIEAKALTVLTYKQLRSSRNFSKGNYLVKGFISESPLVIKENMFYDTEIYNEYLEDFFDGWSELEVDYLH